MSRICGLSDVRVIQTYDYTLFVYKIDSEGLESGEPTHTEPTVSDKADRWYHCNNCGRASPGTEEYTMRSHLGKFHQMFQPFGYP